MVQDKLFNESREMVKYDNKFNLTSLNLLTQVEMDVFFAVCAKLTKARELKIEIPFNELKRLTFLDQKKYSKPKILKNFRDLGQKILSMQFSVLDEDSVEVMTAFTFFKADLKTQTMQIELNPIFSNYFFNIPEKIGFSQFELERFVFLKSKYSKNLFRFLLQNFTGSWTISFSEFSDLLGFPKSYSGGEIKRKIESIIPELEESGYFSDIMFDFTYKKTRGAPFDHIIFNYKVNKNKAMQAATRQTTIMDYDYSEQEKEITTVNTDDPLNVFAEKKVIKEREKCPKCGADVIIKTDKQGNKYRCCTNSKFWKMGSSICEWREYF